MIRVIKCESDIDPKTAEFANSAEEILAEGLGSFTYDW